MRKSDPESKDPKDESLVGETKDEDKEKEVAKNKEVSEIGSNNNNSMSKVNICKADDTSTVTVTSTSLETTKHQNSLEHKTPLLVINNSTQQPSTPDNNNASLNNYCSDKKNEKISSEKSEKSGAGESLELRSSQTADDSFNKTDLQEKIHEIPSANDGSILDRARTIQTGAAADKKNLDTISFTPVISSDDHDNQKLIEEKSIEKTATLDKTNGGSAAKVLVQSSQKLGKSATNLNDEDIIDSSALPVKISSSQLEKEVNTSATDKLELDTLAVNEQKDTRSKDTQPTDSIVDRYLKDKVPEPEIETKTAAVKSDRSDQIQEKNVSADNKPVKTENQLVSAEISAVNKPVKTETQTENQSVTAEVPTVNKPVKTETQAEDQSVTAEVPAVSKPVKSSSFVFISKPVKTEAENRSFTAENQSGTAENLSGTADLPTDSLVKEAEGWVPWEPEPIPEIESVQTLVQKGLEVLIETTELNISSEDEVDSDDDFGDADPVQVIRSCIAACHLLHTTFSRKIFQLCLCSLSFHFPPKISKALTYIYRQNFRKLLTYLHK